MAQSLPVAASIPNQRFSTTLDGDHFVMDVRWNERDESWYLDILDESENPIRRGLKITQGNFIGSHVAVPGMPAGQLVAFDTSGQGIEAGLDDLGERVIVYFVPEDEL